MKCRECGAELMDTDKFCNQCGWKVVKESKCPECGTPLREGTKFCPKCGSPVGTKTVSGEGKKAMKETESPEIPIADIEQNILFETEKEIHKSEKNAGGKNAGADKPRGEDGRDSGGGTGRRGTAEGDGDSGRRRVSAERGEDTGRRRTSAERDESAGRRRVSSERDEDTGRRRTSAERDESAGRRRTSVQKGEGERTRRSDEDRDWEAHRTRKSVPAPEERRRERTAPVRKKVYEDWDDEDDDDDDEDDDEDNDNIMTIVSVVTAFLILALAAFMIFTVVRRNSDKDYGEAAQEELENDSEGGETDNSGDVSNEGNTENEGSGADGETAGGDGQEETQVSAAGTLTIVSNVNVRDNPSTEGTNVLKVAKAGETYEFTGTTEDNNWYIVVLEDGSTGYIFEKYVTVN